MTDGIKKTFAAMLAPGIELSVWGEDVTALDFFGEEAAAVAKAVPTRQEEFLRGRSCLRACLSRLGAPRGPILPAATREPVMPAGYVGAITHGAGGIVAVAARATACASIGIDLEDTAPVDSEVLALALTPEEHALVVQSDEGARLALLIFSAKESIHKAVFPSTRRWFEFSDVTITLLPNSLALGGQQELSGEFLAVSPGHLAREDTELLARLRGRFTVSPRSIATVCRLT